VLNFEEVKPNEFEFKLPVGLSQYLEDIYSEEHRNHYDLGEAYQILHFFVRWEIRVNDVVQRDPVDHQFLESVIAIRSRSCKWLSLTLIDCHENVY